MRDDGDSPIYNPYEKQTVQNENAPGAYEGSAVDVNLAGLQQYAKRMSDSRDDLSASLGQLAHLSMIPGNAWGSSTLGEAAFVRSQVLANASELTQYVSVLGQTLFNVGSAAQTIADIYDSTDGRSAASLADVLFAFADPHAERPAGLPKSIGQTYEEALRAQSDKTAPPADSTLWQPPEETHVGPYETVQTSLANTGEKREIITMATPYGGPITTTTKLYNAKGNLISSTSVQTSTSYDASTGVSSTKEQYYTGEKLTATKVTGTTRGADGQVTSEVVTNSDANGKATGGSTLTVDANGQQTRVSTSVDAEGKSKVTDKMVVGAATEGSAGMPTPLSAKYEQQPELG